MKYKWHNLCTYVPVNQETTSSRDISRPALSYRGAATGCQALYFGRVLHYRGNEKLASDNTHSSRDREHRHLRRVSLKSPTGQSHVGSVLRHLPGTQAGLQDLVLGRGSVDHVMEPTVPFEHTYQHNNTQTRNIHHGFSGK